MLIDYLIQLQYRAKTQENRERRPTALSYQVCRARPATLFDCLYAAVVESGAASTPSAVIENTAPGEL
eukprot:3439766-Pyramimonas_sp.AAC.1